MKKTKTVLLLILGVALLGFSFSKPEKEVETSKKANLKKTSLNQPNVIMLALDDLNDWINPLGYAQAKTPNFDRLAKAGVNFTNAHAPNSYCAPSRSAIWTGLQSSTTGCYKDEVFHYDYPNLLPMHLAFKKGGYDIYGAGKLFHHRAGFVDLRGWNEFYTRTKEVKEVGYEMGYRGKDLPFPDPYPYSPYYIKQGKKIKGGPFLEWAPIPNELSEEMLDNKRTNWVCDLLKKEHKNPFFIAVGLYTPHFPNYAPKKYFDMYDLDKIEIPDFYENDLDDLPAPVREYAIRRKAQHHDKLVKLGLMKEAYRAYLACVSYADAMLGRILDSLEASSYKDNTVFVVWSDQGYHHGEKGDWGKHTLWQETSHVPFIFAGSGLEKGVNVNATVGLIDLYPTLAELCNLPKQHKMDGISLAPTLKGKPMKDRDLLVPYHKRGSYSVINSNWRYIHYNDGTEELYELKKDPNEWYNLATKESYREVINKLKKTAPKEFRKPATPKKSLSLVIKNDTMYWKSKNGGKPQINL
ncbi:MAG: sulfatase [Polaribacter sp.]